MAAINICIGHNYYFMVTQFIHIKLGSRPVLVVIRVATEARAKGCDNHLDFIIIQ